MKHIKKYKLYENNTIKVLGDEKSDIYDCFLDIIDLGYNIEFNETELSSNDKYYNNIPTIKTNGLIIRLRNKNQINNQINKKDWSPVIFNNINYLQSVNDCLYSFIKKYNNVCEIKFYFEKNMDLTIICKELIKIENLSIDKNKINEIVKNHLIKKIKGIKCRFNIYNNDAAFEIHTSLDNKLIIDQITSDLKKMKYNDFCLKYKKKANNLFYTDSILLDIFENKNDIIENIKSDISKYLDKKIDIKPLNNNNDYIFYYKNIALFSIYISISYSSSDSKISRAFKTYFAKIKKYWVKIRIDYIDS